MKNHALVGLVAIASFTALHISSADSPTCEAAAPAFEHSLGMEMVYGCYVNEIQSGSPAAQQGLQEGDLVLSLNNKRFRDFHNTLDFSLQSRGAAADDAADLTVLKPAQTPSGYEPSSRTYKFTIEVAKLARKAAIGFRCSPQAAILSVRDGSPAKAAGVAPGEFLHSVQGEIVANVDNAIKLDQAMHRAVKSGRVELELGKWGKTTVNDKGERQRELLLRPVVIVTDSKEK